LFSGIDDMEKKTFVVGIVGCVILIPLLLLILHMWRRQCRSPNGKLMAQCWSLLFIFWMYTLNSKTEYTLFFQVLLNCLQC
jgi:integral membrane sensor domain MASE1